MASFIDDLGTNKCFDTMPKHSPSPMYHSTLPHTPANITLVFGSEAFEFGWHIFAE
jgi:hypothetical protein